VLSNESWEYDPASDQWKRLADFPGEPRQSAAGFSIGNKLYVGTGTPFGYLTFKDFYEYDPFTDTWTEKTPIFSNRYGTVGFSIDGKGYIVGGDYWDKTGVYRRSGRTYQFDPEGGEKNELGHPKGIWRRMDHMGVAIMDASGFVLNGKAYVVTGRLPDRETERIFVFDPNKGELDTTVNKPKGLWGEEYPFLDRGRTNAVAFSLGGKAYLGTGAQNNFPEYHDLWQYDAETDKWTETFGLPSFSRYGAAIFTINDKAYIIGGYIIKGRKKVLTNEVWEFTPLE